MPVSWPPRVTRGATGSSYDPNRDYLRRYAVQDRRAGERESARQRSHELQLALLRGGGGAGGGLIQPRPSASLLYTQASDPINARLQAVQQNFQRGALRQGMSGGAIAQQNTELALQGAGQLGRAAITAGVEGDMGQDITQGTVDRRTAVLMNWAQENARRIARGQPALPYPADELAASQGGG